MPKQHKSVIVPVELVSRIATGEVIVFVGAGLSQGAGMPGWAGALRGILTFGANNAAIDLKAQKALEKAIRAGKYLQVAEELRSRLPADQFRQALVQIFRRPDIQPTPAHRTLVRIPFRSVVTTNYDCLIETAYASEYNKLAPIYTQQQPPELTAALRGDHYHVLKIHGDINRVETIILGTRDYRSAMYGLGSYHTFMTALFTTRTVLFVGYGLNDPDLQAVLEQLRHDFKGHTNTHYALMSSKHTSELDRAALLRDLGIQVIPYNPSSAAHPEVGLFLSQLQQLLQKNALLATPAATFAHNQLELMNELRSTDENKGALSTQEYIHRLRGVCSRLWEIGSRRTAWTSLIGPFTRAHADVPIRDRVEIGCELAEMLVEDGVPDRASHLISSVKLVDAVSELDDRLLRFRFFKAWGQVLLYLGEYEKAIAAMEDAINTTTDKSEQDRLRARIAETRLLSGIFGGAR